MRAKAQLRTPPSVAALLVAGVVGCATPPPGDPCDPYLPEPAVYAFCVRRTTLAMPVLAAGARCDTLPTELAADCRHAWVQSAVDRPETSRDELLAMCGGQADCAFEVIDRRSSLDPIRQVRDCDAWAGTYAEDCVRHALDVWKVSRPDDAAVAAVGEAARAHPEAFGAAVGIVRACAGRIGSGGASASAELGCPLEPVAAAACVAAAQGVGPGSPACAARGHHLPDRPPPSPG